LRSGDIRDHWPRRGSFTQPPRKILISWSHRGRIGSEAAFAWLAGSAPIPASSGQTIRYRLDRSGETPTLNRRIQEGKSRREASRCLKRYLARNLDRLLEHGAPVT
jgi:transposase